MSHEKHNTPPFDRTIFGNMSKEERLEDFKRRTIAHPHLETADKALTEAILEPGGASIIFVYGPARVGKTVMVGHVIRELTLSILEELEKDRERFAFVYTNLHPPLIGSYSWKRYFQDGLEGLQEPLISHKILLDEEQEDSQTENTEPTPVTRINSFRRLEGTADALRASYETSVRRRRPLAVINDEAQHIGKVGSGRRLQDQLDVIKSLADLTQTVHVLVGTYELLPLSKLSAQLIGRSIDIHFPRYLPTKKDVHQFQRLLKSFQEKLPFAEEPDTLLKNWQFCYERSIGCTGNLRVMLVRAVKAALWDGEKTLTQKVLEKHAFSVAEAHYMMSQAREGEGELAEKSSQLLQLRTWSGFILPQTSTQTTNGGPVTGQVSLTDSDVSNEKTAAASTSSGESTRSEETTTAPSDGPNNGQMSASTTTQANSARPTTERPHRGGARKTSET